MPSAAGPSRRSRPTRRSSRPLFLSASLLLIAAALATVNQEHSPLLVGASKLPSTQHQQFFDQPQHAPAATATSSTSASYALARSHKPWIVAAKDTIFSKVSAFLASALPDPRYFSYDLDKFDPESDAANPLDGGLFGDTAGINWGGSTIEVVRSQAIFLTRAAAFGPRITAEEGLRGFLLPISDFYHPPRDAKPSNTSLHACPYHHGPGWRHQDSLSNPNDSFDTNYYYDHARHLAETNASNPQPPKDWIALVERGGGCGFADKVRVAQALGAIAVVVGDAPSPTWEHGRTGDPNEGGDPGLSGKRLITMFATGDTADIDIPSTFVTRPSFLDLSRLIDELEKEDEKWQQDHPADQGGQDKPKSPKGLEIVISKDDLMWEWPLIDLGILLLLLPSIMTVITVIVHRIRMVRQRRKERAPELVVLGLPCLIWRSGGQPWEKIEGPDVDPGPGNGGTSADQGSDPPTSACAPPVSPPVHVNPDDLEASAAGGANGESIPLLADDANEAGPSRPSAAGAGASSSNGNGNGNGNGNSKTPSFLPPGRTYFSTDECAICLCDFVDGDRVRVLPCGHIFHRQEIDDWLLRIKKLCPICKRDITVPIPPPAPPVVRRASSSGASLASPVAVAPEANEATPLLNDAGASNRAEERSRS